MKIPILLFVTFLSLPSLAGTTPRVPASDMCDATVRIALENKFHERFFDGGNRHRDIESVDCELKTSKSEKKYNSCEVCASDGNGAGDLTFMVLLNDKCTKAFSSFVIGEE